MSLVSKEVQVAKEASEVMALAVAVVKHFKEGKGTAEVVELLDELVEAISGVDKLDDEWKENPTAVVNAVLLSASEVVGVLVNKEAE